MPLSRIVVCIPVFDDWEAVRLLLAELEGVAAESRRRFEVLLVDDGSRQECPADLCRGIAELRRVQVVRLRRNLGHQRAIAVGLAHIHATRQCDAVVVMDGDGEDPPAQIETLLRRCENKDGKAAVFAGRAKRAEGIVFRVGYLAFRLLHRLLTGRRVEVGNFSVLPSALLAQIVVVSETWNHYAAAVVHARLPTQVVPLARSQRLGGESRMKIPSLIVHGLSAISVYSDTVGVRLLCGAVVLFGAVLLGALTLAALQFLVGIAIPLWAYLVSGLLGLALVHLAAVLMFMVLFLLNTRDRHGFLPLRDHGNYVSAEDTLHGA